MQKIHLWVIVAVLLAVPLPGGGVSKAEVQSTVNEILKKTENHYSKIRAFSADFHQSVSSAATGAIISEASGRLYYEKPRQMRWEYEKPEAQVFVANHQMAWLYVPSERQLSLMDPKRIFSHPLAQTYFDGVSELRKYYDVTLDLKQSSNDTSVLKLVPKREDPEIKLLFLSIQLAGYRLSSIEIHNALGNVNRITLESQRPISNPDPRLFRLEIPAGTEVLDVDGQVLTQPQIEALMRNQPSESKSEK